MKIIIKENDIILENEENFNLSQTFYCGQCFRFTENDNGSFTTVAKGRMLNLKQEDNTITFYNTTKDEFEKIWVPYFSLDINYKEMIQTLKTDEHMKACISYGSGIRILRQDLFETIISFIISSNNNIKRIQGIIEKICEKYGKKLTGYNEAYYDFPTPYEMLGATEDELFSLKMGYRNKYIYDAVNKINSGEVDIKKIPEMSTEEAKKELMKIKGIGEKVADCILLFVLSRYEVCPQDVWVKRIFETRYNIDTSTFEKGYNFASEKWGKYAGLAQQYLFYYERENASEEKNKR